VAAPYWGKSQSSVHSDSHCFTEGKHKNWLRQINAFFSFVTPIKFECININTVLMEGATFSFGMPTLIRTSIPKLRTLHVDLPTHLINSMVQNLSPSAVCFLKEEKDVIEVLYATLLSEKRRR
jgi:hypothetical protein